MAFNVKQYLIKINGGKDYLPVAYRLVWFREEHPDFGISTTPIDIDLEKGYALFHAKVTDSSGRTLAEGSKMETAGGFADFVEKAETGSIGRALGVLGYGTQFAPEFDEADRIVDSPMPISNGNVSHAIPKPNRVANIGRDFSACADCGKPLTNSQTSVSQHKYGRPLCPAHQAAAKA